MAVVRASFRPEFLNRVDEIILFHRLKRNEMTKIVDIQLRRLGKLVEDRKITIALDPSAREWLAEMILAGTVKDGDKVVISAGKQGLTFNGKLAAAA